MLGFFMNPALHAEIVCIHVKDFLNFSSVSVHYHFSPRLIRILSAVTMESAIAARK